MRKIIFAIICVLLLPIYVIADDEIPVERIMIDADSLYVETSKSMYMQAMVYPSNATDKGVTWSSSDTTIASINAETGGLATKNKTGTVTITATANDGSGVSGSIDLIVGYVNVEVGEETTIGNTNYVSYDTVEWIIDDENILEKTGRTGLVSIGNNYRHTITVRGKSNGNTQVTMKTISGDTLSTNKAYVYTPISSLSCEDSSLLLEKGQTKTINVDISPDTTSNDLRNLFYYTENDEIASVDENGVVTANGTGETNLIVSSQYGKKTITIPIKVVIYATDLTLSGYDIVLSNSVPNYQIEYTITPDDVSENEVTFESMDTSVVVVSSQGLMSAIANGSTTIKVKTKDKKVEKTINVIVQDYTPCTSITINGDDIIRMNDGENYQATYTLYPTGCPNTGVTWEISDNSVATIDNSGIINAIKTGETTFSIRTGSDLTHSKKVNVNNYVAVQSINITDEKVIVTTAGNIPTYQIKYELNPKEPSFKEVIWTIDDSNIATISDKGLVTAVAPGMTTATARTVDGNKIATVPVEVIVGYVEFAWFDENQPSNYQYYGDGSYGYSMSFLDSKMVYYPDKVVFPDYIPHGCEGVEWWYKDSNGNGQFVYTQKYDGNYSYDGSYYQLFAKQINPIAVKSITIPHKYYYTWFQNEAPYFYFYFNDGEEPLNDKVKMISDNQDIIASSDWVSCEKTRLDDGRYLYRFYDWNNPFKNYGEVKLTLITQDGNHSDTIYAKYSESYGNVWGYESYYTETDWYQTDTLIIKNDTTIEEFYKNYNLLSNNGNYFENGIPFRMYFIDENNKEITNLKTIINKKMKLALVDVNEQIAHSFPIKIVYGYTCQEDTGYHCGFGYDSNNMYYSPTGILPGTKVRIYATIDWGYSFARTEIIRDYDGKNVRAELQKEGDLNAREFEIIMPEYPITLKVIVNSLKLNTPAISIEKGNNNSLVLKTNRQTDVDSYFIYRSTNKKNWSRIAETLDATYTNTGLTYGTTYYYKIKSFNYFNGETDYSNVVSMKVVPDKVNNLRVTSIGQKNIKVSWDKVSVTGYEVYMNNKKVATISKSGTLSYNKTKLSTNKNYSFKVRAYKTVKGKKIYGAFSDTITALTAPATPKLSSVSLKDYNALNVNFKSVGGAVKYEIVRSTSKKGTYSKIGELTAAGTYVDNDLNTGTTYYYKVRACNKNNNCGAYSSIVSKKVIPLTPKNATKVVDYYSINLSWGNVNGADGYEIQRSTNKKKGYKTIATITTPTYNNTKLSSNKTYYYKVRAYKLVNGKKIYSSYSSIITAKTKKLSTNQKKALDKAKSLLKSSSYSQDGLIDKLVASKFSVADATFAIKYCGANWNDQALKKAKSYLAVSEMTKEDLINQLNTDKFTDDQISYALSSLNM